MDPDDFLLMSTDGKNGGGGGVGKKCFLNCPTSLSHSLKGLGDAIDPIRIFLEPSFAKKFAGLVNVPFINNNVAKTIPTVLTNWGVLATKLPLTSQETHALKQTIIDMVKRKTRCNGDLSLIFFAVLGCSKSHAKKWRGQVERFGC